MTIKRSRRLAGLDPEYNGVTHNRMYDSKCPVCRFELD